MEVDEMMYRATLDQLSAKLDGEINPCVSAVAKAIGEHPNRLTGDPDFYRRTTGKRTRRILVTQLAAYLLMRKN